MFRTDLQRRVSFCSDNYLHIWSTCHFQHAELMHDEPRAPSPLDEAATKIQAVFKGHLVSEVKCTWILYRFSQVRAHPEKFGIDKAMTRTQSSEKMVALNNKKDQK